MEVRIEKIKVNKLEKNRLVTVLVIMTISVFFSFPSFACEDSGFQEALNKKNLKKRYRVYDKNPKVHGKSKVKRLGLIQDNDYVIAENTLTKDYVHLVYLDKDCQRKDAWTFKKALSVSLSKVKILSTDSSSEDTISEEPVTESEVVSEPVAESLPVEGPERSTPAESVDEDLVEFSHLSGKLQDMAKDLCDYGDDSVRTENCLKVLRAIDEEKLPKNPILYALKSLKSLQGKMCRSRRVHNGCMVLASDLDKTYENFAYRHPAYFINLCVGDESRTTLKDVYYKTFTNRGTGSKKNRQKANYKDLPLIKTTLPGVFLTGILKGFHPFHKSRSKYKKYLGYSTDDPRCKGTGGPKNQWLKGCPVLRLSVNRINGALTENGKPMHTSPFKSSSGCPSIGQEDNWMVRHMAAYRSTLYIAYTRTEKYRNYFKFSNFCK